MTDETRKPKVYPASPAPNEADYMQAEEFVVPKDWPAMKAYTDEMRDQIDKTARQIMIRRQTIQ